MMTFLLKMDTRSMTTYSRNPMLNFSSIPSNVHKVFYSIDKVIVNKKTSWTEKETKLFMEAIDKYGPKDLKKITSYIKSRSLS